jgi:hypothetical protein
LIIYYAGRNRSRSERNKGRKEEKKQINKELDKARKRQTDKCINR